MRDSFDTRDTLVVGDRTYVIHSLAKLGEHYDLTRLPFSLKVLLENLLRSEDGVTVTRASIEAVARWKPDAVSDTEIAFMPARVVLQDFTGVPCIVDLAAMREAVVTLGGSAASIDPAIPAELVIDHSVQVDSFGKPGSLEENGRIEFARNEERYAFLRWGQKAFANLSVVPPSTGIVHQVNLEHLARVVETRTIDGELHAFPDTVFGTDSHTTMVNGLGVLGWGVGGIEAEAAMLGQASSMPIPEVVGFELVGTLAEGTTATDLVLTVTQRLRAFGVVGKFVEFFGSGLASLPLADRATIANMAPEYGATCGIFPIDDEVLRYLRLTGRDEARLALVEAYAKAQGLFRTDERADYTATLRLDLADVEPSLAGPKRPQDRLLLSEVKPSFRAAIAGRPARAEPPKTSPRDGAVVIAAITSCTNTSNPAVMLAAGLLARNAVDRGLSVAPWVKTSLAPGSRVVTDYLARAGLSAPLEALGFYVVGYGCTTCIGNSGPLAEGVSAQIAEGELTVASVLSGNRNFEGRVHPEVKLNYLASPPLVVAYALAGTVDLDLEKEPLGFGSDGRPVFLRDLWPSAREVQDAILASVGPELFARHYAHVFEGDARWNALPAPDGEAYRWNPASTYIKRPPYFDGIPREVGPIEDLRGARVLGIFGDSITTDHISPAGDIALGSPAGRYLRSLGVAKADFNSYGARRGNDEVMVRGTFANIRIRNLVLGGAEGGETLHQPSGERMPIHDAAVRYAAEGVPLVVFAGKEYGTGSSRDWAAKGTRLLGVKAVVAESFERIHRANLVGMGVLPLRFPDGVTAPGLGLRGDEVVDVLGLEDGASRTVQVRATRPDGHVVAFAAEVLLLTPMEVAYFRHGGILPYVLRQLAARSPA
ncbi:MAG: aconitate hydratase AcnA [Polyangiales bacterium]